ncbi:hypothetical protein V5799_007165 [Amblyomma americanum]|uniref:Uncharacterized protein n=1 Tax=Amblyomma americanum TaxID=6943 RepID=A0AAQ4DUB5_AMBAM
MRRQCSSFFCSSWWLRLLHREASGCSGFHIPNRRRLMEAKATFGRLMQLCKKHLEASAKLFPPKQFPTVVAITCHYYNSCRDSIPEQTPWQLLACGFGAAMDRTGLFYTHLNISDEVRKKMVDGMFCVARAATLNTSMQAIDDLATYTRWAALAFG